MWWHIAETRFRLSAKRTSPFKSARPSVQSTTGSRGVSISGSNVGYNMFRGSVKSTGYPLHSPVSPSLPLPCVTVCHPISTGVYHEYCISFPGVKRPGHGVDYPHHLATRLEKDQSCISTAHLCRRFGTLCPFHLHGWYKLPMKMKHTVCRNVDT
jgi:hypothetical protein